jgi:hypothetical protein
MNIRTEFWTIPKNSAWSPSQRHDW